jgi:RNA polymerase sigma-70 factor (ECF subfamily)
MVDATLPRAAPGSETGPGAAGDSASGTGDDEELVAQVVLGSEPAFAALYDRHVRAVFHAALRLVRDRGAAEEVVQETFLALWNRAELFDANRGALGAWLVTIAHNRALDHLRAAGRRPATPFSVLSAGESAQPTWLDGLMTLGEPLTSAAPEPEPEVVVDRRETARMVTWAMTTLGDEERLAIGLAYRDGLSQAEIAARLGWPLGTVKTRSRRALLRLRAALAAFEAAAAPETGVSTGPGAAADAMVAAQAPAVPCDACP